MAHLKSLVFLILLLGCSMYSYWLSTKDFEWIVPHINDRSPAAVRESESFKNIMEKPLRVYKREAVLNSISVSNKNGKAFFSMGQFAVPAAQQPNLVCLEYPFLRLQFLGDGLTVNGQRPSVTVYTACAIQDKNHDDIRSVPLPFGDLQRLPAQNQMLEYTQPNFPVHILFDGVQGVWPPSWHLEKVEFSRVEFSQAPVTGGDQKDGERIVFNNSDFLQKLGSPIFVK